MLAQHVSSHALPAERAIGSRDAAGPRSTRRVALASPIGDVGWGSVWPASVLVGSVASALLGAGTWIGAAAGDVRAPWPFVVWTAEHAATGAALGALASAVFLAGARLDPLLRDLAQRRAASTRLTLLWCALAPVCLAALAGPLERVRPEAVLGFAAGLLAWLPIARAWLGPRPEIAAVPRLDPARVAVVVALLTCPLAGGMALPTKAAETTGACAPLGASLWRAWQVMLAG
jgi:hypothetical protein